MPSPGGVACSVIEATEQTTLRLTFPEEGLSVTVYICASAQNEDKPGYALMLDEAGWCGQNIAYALGLALCFIPVAGGLARSFSAGGSA